MKGGLQVQVHWRVAATVGQSIQVELLCIIFHAHGVVDVQMVCVA
jgi:hypothetical protein